MKAQQIARMAAGALAAARTTTSKSAPAPAPAPEKEFVSFDPNDGRKRVLITVNEDGTFAPVVYWGMNSALGNREANIIAAHGALIMAEDVARGEAATDGV